MRGHRSLGVMAVSALAMTACLSLDRPAAGKRRFLLEATRAQTLAAPGEDHLVVPMFHTVAAWAGPGFARRRADGAVEVDFYAEFFVPPSTALAEISRRWLADAGLFATVSSEASRLPATHWLEADVLELSVDERNPNAPRTVLELEFVLFDRERRVVHRARVHNHGSIDDTQPETVIAAWNRGLAAILTEFEAGLRTKLGR